MQFRLYMNNMNNIFIPYLYNYKLNLFILISTGVAFLN